MSNKKPRVSIGIPIYNGEQFIQEALDATLAQTFEDFELIISDNASTDRTEEICRKYAAKDQRISYYRNEQNLGAAWNYNRVFELSKGEYFKWAAHDDLFAPEFLERCVEVLDRDPSLVLCYSQERLIDTEGKFIEKTDDIYFKTFRLNTDSPQPHKRFYELVCITHNCFHVFGLLRASTLKQTPLIGGYSDSDRVLLARLALLGRFYELPEYLFFPRRHAAQSSSSFVSKNSRRFYTLWFDPARKGQLIFPHWRIFWEYLNSIEQSPLSWQERIGCYLCLGYWLWKWKRRLLEDLAILISQKNF